MKKSIAMILTLILTLTSLSVAANAAASPVTSDKLTETITDEYPIIIVSGMDFSDGLHYDRGTENEKTVTPSINAGEIVKVVAKAAFTSISHFNSANGIKILTDYAYTLFAGYACNKDGSSLFENVTSASYPMSVKNYPELYKNASGHEKQLVKSAVARYGASKVYFCYYDWRMNPYDTASQLNDLVLTACEDNNSDKVNMVCCSMGGIVTLAYLDKYSSERISSLVSNSATMYGTYVVGDLFKGDAVIEADAAYRYLLRMLPAQSGLINIAYKTGILKAVAKLLNSFIEKNKQQIYNDILTPVFATMPVLWALVQPEDFDSSKEFLFSGKEEEYARIIEIADSLQATLVTRRDDILAQSIAQGMKLSVIANYNTPLVCVYKNCATQGDGTLETAYMSLGATVSDVGATLSDDYISSHNSEYISADGCIDASTCLYPDYTWFCKNAEHVACRYGSDYTALVFSLVEADTQPDIHTWEQYPQFMCADSNENLTALK